MWIIFTLIVSALMTVYFVDAYRDWVKTRRWRRHAVLTLPVFILTCVVALEVVYQPWLTPERRAGFGPDWLCSSMKVSDTVCVKAR
jgi:hypothetical protein